jgi:cysteine desulfurase family protein
VIYLDHAATSWPKPRAVVTAVRKALAEVSGNPGRTHHRSSYDAVEKMLECRENLASLFKIASPLRVCFTSNATESLNLALKGLLKPGDHVVCTSMEHNSVWRPLVRLQECDVEFSIARADRSGIISVESILQNVRPNTRLIAAIHASNVNGSINPIAEIGRVAKERNIAFLVDAAQSAGSIPIDVEAMHIDLLAFPGHKGLLGPQGTGGLYIREGIDLVPLKEGGTGSNSNSASQPDFFPDRFESGTLNVPGIIGLNEGVRHVLKTGVAKIQRREWHLTGELLKGLTAIDGVTIHGPAMVEPRAPVVSFNVESQDPSEVGEFLERRFDIACRTGFHCAFLAHQTQGTENTGTVRFSLGASTTDHEIEGTIEAVRCLREES